jgi:hypothetical protein
VTLHNSFSERLDRFSLLMLPQLMSRADQSSRRPATVVTIIGCVAVLTFGASRIATQSRIIRPQPPANSNNPAKRNRVATLRASDSPEGSRVALTSDQSLSDYEAYRRGDRFYVKIPPSDVPRSEIVRGRAFADVKVQRGADSTVVSFRLQPGATARVEQSANKLNVVFTMPGARSSASNSGRDVARNDAGPAPPNDQRRRPTSNSNTSSANSNRPGANRNGADRANANRTNAAAAKPSPTPKPSPSPTAKPSATPQSSPATKASPLVAQQKASPSGSPALGEQTPQSFTWNNFKERARYWILLAQLNPVQVGIGAAVLLLLIGLLVLQIRRAKGTRRVRPRKEPKKTAPVVVAAKAASTSAAADVAGPVESGAAMVGAAAASTSLAAAAPTDEPAAAPRVNGDRHERVARVSEEVKKVMAGGDYDESIVASDDRETRQLVGAELLSALVGRNLQRRERARAVFMKHGYFDDATRDLRIAESDNERAAAARRLSFVHDREATPHLIGALDDSSPDVRRAAIEALMDLRDPAAIAPLNSLMQTETDRKVPRSLIKHAIEACASSGAEVNVTSPAAISPPPASAEAPSQPSETEREVIEI